MSGRESNRALAETKEWRISPVCGRTSPWSTQRTRRFPFVFFADSVLSVVREFSDHPFSHFQKRIPFADSFERHYNRANIAQELMEREILLPLPAGNGLGSGAP